MVCVGESVFASVCLSSPPVSSQFSFMTNICEQNLPFLQNSATMKASVSSDEYFPPLLLLCPITHQSPAVASNGSSCLSCVLTVTELHTPLSLPVCVCPVLQNKVGVSLWNKPKIESKEEEAYTHVRDYGTAPLHVCAHSRYDCICVRAHVCVCVCVCFRPSFCFTVSISLTSGCIQMQLRVFACVFICACVWCQVLHFPRQLDRIPTMPKDDKENQEKVEDDWFHTIWLYTELNWHPWQC